MNDRERILTADNPYAVLQLQTTATPEEAKYQYFKLVRRFTPEHDEEAFRIIRRAYEDLKNPARKAAADVMLFTAPHGDLIFVGIDVSTESQVKLNREIQILSQEPPKDEATKRNLINCLKERACLLAKKGKYSDALNDLDEIEKFGGTGEEVEQARAFLLSRIALKLATQGHYVEAAHRWRRAERMAPDNSFLLHNLAVCATLTHNHDEEDKYWVETLRAWHRELNTKGDDEYTKNLIVETHRRFGGKYLRQTGDESLREEVSKVKAPPGVAFHAMGMAPGVSSASTGPVPGVPAKPSMPGAGSAPGGKGPRQKVADQPKPVPSAPPGTPAAAGLDAFARKDWRGAVQHFEKHLKTNPEDGNILDKLGWALLHAGQGNRAFALWLKMLREGPDQETGKESFIRAKVDTAKVLQKKMMTNPAMVQLKDVLKHVPDSKEVLEVLGNLYKEKNDLMNAVFYLEKALEVDPNDKELRLEVRQLRSRARSVRAIM
jgi:tetratricopeptide (TPR) repeat protein